MARGDSIEPFPSGIDRFRFGDYLSGLVDGEGHFSLIAYKETGKKSCRFLVRFQIGLRTDDDYVLRLVQSYFGCGRFDSKKQYSPNHNPQTAFRVNRIEDIVKRVIPHFDEHPLYAKKSADFVVWKKAAFLLYTVSQRARCRNLDDPGKISKWYPHEADRFRDFVAELAEVRRYKT